MGIACLRKRSLVNIRMLGTGFEEERVNEILIYLKQEIKG